MRPSETVRQLLALFVVLGLYASISFGQKPNASDGNAARFDEPGSLSLDGLVRLGIERNGELNAARAELAAARARLRQAGLLQDPEVEATRRVSSEGMDSSLSLGISIPLEITGSRGAKIAVSSAELAIKELDVRARERDLAVDIRRGYLGLVAARAKLELVLRSVDAARGSLNLTQAGVTVGKIAPLTESMEAVELNELLAMKERGEAEVDSALSSLKSLVGLGPADLLSLKTEVKELTDPPLSLKSAIALALQRSIELEGARLIERLASARLSLARADGRPALALAGSYEKGRTGFDVYGTALSGRIVPIEREMRVFSFGLRITLPILNGNRGEIGAIQEELKAATLRREFGEITTANEVTAVVATLERARRAIQLTRTGALEPSRANLEVSRQAHRLGSVSLPEFLMLQRRQLELEMAYIEGLRQAQEAEIAYLKLIGSEAILGR